MPAPRLVLTAIVAFGSVCVAPIATAQRAPQAAQNVTERARKVFGGIPSARDRAFSVQAVGARDVITLIDQCVKLSPTTPTYWPSLKAGGWMLESGENFPADYGWRGVFIRPGQRGKLIEHISQGDILHCEASGETGNSAQRAQIWAAVVSHYRGVVATEFKGQNGFIENIRREVPSALKSMYVSAQGFVFSHSDENAKSTLISVDVF